MPSPMAIEAAARALHRFGAPRVGNDVERWETIGASGQVRWMRMAQIALQAAEDAREADTPVMVERR